MLSNQLKNSQKFWTQRRTSQLIFERHYDKDCFILNGSPFDRHCDESAINFYQEKMVPGRGLTQPMRLEANFYMKAARTILIFFSHKKLRSYPIFFAGYMRRQWASD